ncbi:hypothetical protein ACJ6WF_00925 [Streptomyces sp. MMS24-I2-30]|uniref:hypothetical protein n=1 Tax=Streptomyces sp. MMS24-I2-30 TaxID=3351564 RepID=UPI003896DF24
MEERGALVGTTAWAIRGISQHRLTAPTVTGPRTRMIRRCERIGPGHGMIGPRSPSAERGRTDQVRAGEAGRDEQVLRRQLDAVKQQIGELKTGEAWLLLAMGRFDAAAETAEAARREAAGRTRLLSSLREVLREAALVTSAARIAQRAWVQAETAAEGYIDLFGRDPEIVRLLELARWGRGTLGPIESWREVSNPGKELAAFDPVACASGALARLDVDGRTSAAAQEPVGEPVVPFYHGSRGRLPVDEEALRTELAAVADETGK